MPISVSPITHIIDVPQSYLTLVSGTLYDMDTNQFRKDLSLWSATEEGRTEPFPYDHNTEYTVVGDTFVRKVEILPPYSIRFENTGVLYSVRMLGSNNNFHDLDGGIFVPSNVIPITANTAGSIIITQGSGVSAQDVIDIARATRDDILSTEIFP